MTNLSDFLKVKKVRFIAKDNYLHLTYGRAYDVIGVSHERIKVHNDKGNNSWYDMDCFEPVLDSAENPLQNIELTPEFEAVEPTFKVGDKVYVGLTGKIRKIDSFNSNDGSFTYSHNDITTYGKNKDVVKATQENYEMLCKLYPRIKFEAPPKELTGSDLCRAMLEKGWKYVPCYVHDGSDDEAINRKHYVSVKNETPRSGYNFSGTGANDWKYAVPIDPRTGEPLTQAVLDE